MQQTYEIIYYVYVLIFGLYISIRTARPAMGPKEWRMLCVLSPVLLLAQGVCLQIWDIGSVRLLYPFITHLPTMLALMLYLKARWNVALISVLISYSLCQLPRWIGLVIHALGFATLPSALIHLALSQLILLMLARWCLGAIHDLIAGLDRPLSRFGMLPAIYYLYEYFMVYTQDRYADILALHELLSTGLVLFYVLFAIAYRREMEKRAQAEYQAAAFQMDLDQAAQEIDMLRMIQDQTAIHRHDLHHHLTMIGGLLQAGKADQAAAYIRDTAQEIDRIAPQRHCENETVNLLLGAFAARANRCGVHLAVRAALPRELALPDTELCALLSNALENALNAVSLLPEGTSRQIDVFCGIRQSQLLFEIKNPYAGEILMQDGLPLPPDGKRHYGCRSIRSIAQRRQGMCSFEPAQGMFVLRVAIPLEAKKML